MKSYGFEIARRAFLVILSTLTLTTLLDHSIIYLIDLNPCCHNADEVLDLIDEINRDTYLKILGLGIGWFLYACSIMKENEDDGDDSEDSSE